MEETLNKLVNLVIGAVKNADEGLKDATGKIQTEINELISKGAASTDEGSAKVKAFVDDSLKKLSDAQAQIQSRSEEIYTQIKPSIDQAVEFVKNLRSRLPGQAQA